MYKLPIDIEIETKKVLKKTIKANTALAELRGSINRLPNPQIILNTITLREAKESSEIENIFTTYDDLYKEMTLKETYSPNAKEVLSYRSAINYGYKLVNEKGFISTNILKEVHHIIEPNKGGIRTTMGTVIKNNLTDEIVHTPPQNEREIRDYLSNLEKYMNDDTDMIDPLIKMGLIHLQFEMIHPFYDGNGRVGRILNLMYLLLTKKLDIPILYLSKYIIDNKEEYYFLLHKVNSDKNYICEFIEYMLEAIEITSKQTLEIISTILILIEETKDLIKDKLPKIYSSELAETLFYEFYTKNEYIQNSLSISRNTATKYLKALEEIGVLESEQVGREVIYKNVKLFNLTNIK